MTTQHTLCVRTAHPGAPLELYMEGPHPLYIQPDVIAEADWHNLALACGTYGTHAAGNIVVANDIVTITVRCDDYTQVNHFTALQCTAAFIECKRIIARNRVETAANYMKEFARDNPLAPSFYGSMSIAVSRALYNELWSNIHKEQRVRTVGRMLAAGDDNMLNAAVNTLRLAITTKGGDV